MTQTPNVIGIVVMQRLKERGLPATPDNYADQYYAVSGLPRPAPPEPPPPAEPADSAPSCLDLLPIMRQMLQDLADKTEVLSKELGTRNEDLKQSTGNLKASRERNEILRLLALAIAQTSGIQGTVESSHEELVETRRSLQTIQQELADTREMLQQDSLTGALNRQGLDLTLAREIARAQRSQGKLTLAMLELDRFQALGNQHGKEAGDRLLVHITGLIRSVMRKSDALVRYDGATFYLILPDTDVLGARFVLGRLHQINSKMPLVHGGKTLSTTFGVGVASLKRDETASDLLRRADEARQSAKETGNNCIKLA